MNTNIVIINHTKYERSNHIMSIYMSNARYNKNYLKDEYHELELFYDDLIHNNQRL